MSDDDDDEEIACLIKESFAEAMPEIRARNAEFRERVAKFFDLQVKHLPEAGTDGWSRLLATYVWTVKPYDVADLRHMLDRKIFNEPPT
jgi:hypothetical protein